MKKIRFIAAALMLVGLGCNKEDQAVLDREAILAYISDNNLTMEEHESGIFYRIDDPGSGGSPTLQSSVTVRYKGYYLDGAVFDQTVGGQTVTFPLGGLIEGWRIAIPLLQRGGEGLFLIPSGLAYGSNPPPGVRRNAPMAFEIELVGF